MRDLIDIFTAFESLSAEDTSMALATIVAVEGSSYRRPGARMLVALDGRRFGTVSGGCLEADVARRAQAVIASGLPTLCRYETGDDPDAILFLDDDASGNDPGVSLGCGGALEIFIECIYADRPGVMAFIAAAIRENTASRHALIYRVGGDVDFATGTLFPFDESDDPSFVGLALASHFSGTEERPAKASPTDTTLPLPVLGERAGERAFEDRIALHRTPLPQNRTSNRAYFHRHLLSGGWIDLLIESITPPPHLMILGDGSDVLPLIELARFQGWRTTVVGYRAGAKLPSDLSIQLSDHTEAELVIDPAAAVVVMTHDLLRDARLLRRLAETPPAYVGVLGPLHRTRRLLAAAQINETVFDGRFFAPIGLDLGGEGPQRVALSIISEIAAVFSDHAGGHLSDKASGIHESAPVRQSVSQP